MNAGMQALRLFEISGIAGLLQQGEFAGKGQGADIGGAGLEFVTQRGTRRQLGARQGQLQCAK